MAVYCKLKLQTAIISATSAPLRLNAMTGWKLRLKTENKYVYLTKFLSMDSQTRKLNLITYLAQLQDENVLEKIENYIFTKIRNVKKDGNYKTQDDLEKISANW